MRFIINLKTFKWFWSIQSTLNLLGDSEWMGLSDLRGFWFSRIKFKVKIIQTIQILHPTMESGHTKVEQRSHTHWKISRYINILAF